MRLFLRFANRFVRFCPTSDEPILALIDFHKHTRGGHFGYWLRFFTLQFAQRFSQVVVLTPEPVLTHSLFQQESSPPNVFIKKLPKGINQGLGEHALRKIPELRRARICAFVMWGYDLLPIMRGWQNVRRPPWATLQGVSWSARGFSSSPAPAEKELVNFMTEDSLCAGFVQPDLFVNGRHAKSVWLPDFEHVSLVESSDRRLELIRAHKGTTKCVACIGMLTGFRGVDALVGLAKRNPNVRFVLAGRLAPETFTEETKRLLKPGKLSNLFVSDGFIACENLLTSVIASVDALFIDGRSYPVHSSIACRAAFHSKCIISPQSNSWISDVIATWGAGLFVDESDTDLEMKLAAWKLSGGPMSARKASLHLRDKSELDNCFDKISGQLRSRLALKV